MNHWLIDSSAHQQLSRLVTAALNPSAAQLAEVEARTAAVRSGAPARALSQDGRTSRIDVSGILTPRPNLLAMLFGGGGTSYDEILVTFDTPGGTVSGLFETIDALSRTAKPMRAVASMALSAGYALAASTGKIQATSRAASFGSVGVVATFTLDPTVVEVTSTQAPNKRPDVQTDSGKAVVRSYLDELHTLFADAIALGRGTTVAGVNANFGKGAVLLATAAQAVGMIDSIKASPAAAGPLPRRKPGESNDALQARLLDWVQAGGDDLPVKVLAQRVSQTIEALNSKDVSHGDDEQLPHRAWGGGRDLGDEVADQLLGRSSN